MKRLSANQRHHDRRHSSNPSAIARDAANDRFLTITSLLLIVTLILAPARAADWQSTESLVDAVREHISAARTGMRSDQAVDVQPPDRRLRLINCETPLITETLGSSARSERLTVKVSCRTPQPWKVYIQARIDSFAEVLVAARHLPRGHVIGEGDYRRVRRSLNGLNDYLTDPQRIVGQSLRQAVVAGALLQQRHTRAPTAIKRGQSVTLISGGEGIAIRMAGTAMTDGSIGTRIPVRNQSSGRIVEGIVVDAHNVTVP